MKVAFFVQYCHEAGTYFRWHNLAISLLEYGASVDVYAGDFNHRGKKRIELRSGVKYIITPSLYTAKVFGNPSDPFTAFYRLLQPLQEEYDVIHLFQPFLHAALPWLRFRKTKKSLFLYDWDDLWIGGIFQQPNSIRGWYTYKIVSFFEKYLPGIAHGVTTCSTFLKEKINADKQVEIVYNGFTPKKKMVCHSILKKEENNFYIGYVGKTAAEILWLSHLAKEIERKGITAKLVIVGPDPQNIFESKILENKNVIYLGEVSAEEAFLICSDIDLGLLPLADTSFNRSRFPIKFFDYLSAGTPVCYSAVGELKIVAQNIEHAYECGASERIWVERVCGIIMDMVNREKPNINFEKIASMYSWKENGNQLFLFYKKLLAAHV